MHANNTCHFQTWSIKICPCSLHALFPLSMLMQANTEILEAAGDLGSCKLKMAVKQNSGSSGFLTYCSEGATHWSGTPILGLQETGNKILLYLSCFINFGLFVFVTSVTLTNIAINWASEHLQGLFTCRSLGLAHLPDHWWGSNSVGLGWGPRIFILNKFTDALMLLVQGPHFENHCFLQKSNVPCMLLTKIFLTSAA